MHAYIVPSVDKIRRARDNVCGWCALGAIRSKLANGWLIFFIRVVNDGLHCSKYDLYSKSKTWVDVEAVKPYYQSLIQKVLQQLTSNRLRF